MSRSLRFLAFLLAAASCGPREEPSAAVPAGSEELLELARIEDLRRRNSPELVESLASGEPQQRLRATRAMGRIQSPRYALPLAQAAGPDSPPELREGAMFALGQLGLAEGVEIPSEALAPLYRALQETDPSVVAIAAQALGKLAPAAAEGPLTDLLRHPAAEVREQAAYGLFRLRFAPVWRKETREPPALSPAAIQAITEALGDEAVRVRRAAAHTFSRYGEKAARAALEGALGDGDELVRLFAARGLGRAADRGAVGALAGHLGDPAPVVRTAVVAALAALEGSDGIPLKLASDEDFQVRAAVARAWATSSRPDTEAALATLLEDPSTTVRAAAIEALARRRGESFAAALGELLSSAPWTLRVAAAQAVRHVGAGASEILARALEDEDPRVQAAALETLGELATDAGATERIAAALTSEDLAVRGTAVAALQKRRHPRKVEWLEGVLASSPGVDWVEVREGLVAALEEEEGGGELLLRLASDPASSVARRARAALGKRGIDFEDPTPAAGAPPQASPFLESRVPDPTVVVLETVKGDLEIRTLPREAPLHVASFVELVRKGFYDGLIWHRVVPGFVIQGGDPLGNGWGGPGYALRDEIHPRPFRRGSVGMPKAGKDTGGCQIFVTHVPTPHLDGNYTIFGEVVRGLEVIDRIEVGDRIVRAYVGD